MDSALAFEEAFGPLYRQARLVAWRLLGDEGDAEDGAAEAMARALVAWRKVGVLPYREAWVMRVAANVAIDVSGTGGPRPVRALKATRRRERWMSATGSR